MNMHSKKINKKIVKLAYVLCAFLVLITFQSKAVEASIQAHKVDQDKSYGYTLAVGGSFFSQRAINWQG